MEHVGYITLPLYKLGDRQLTGFRQEMIEAGPHKVSSGSGLGTDNVWAEISTDGKMTYYCVHGRDLLAASLSHVSHPDFDRIPVTEAYKQ